MNRIGTLIAIVVALLLPTTLPHRAHAQEGQWLDCVYPKTKPKPNGNLMFVHPIYVYDQPNSSMKPTFQLKLFDAFLVGAERNGFIQLVGSSDSPPDYPQFQVVGWAHSADFVSQDWRNCN